MTPPDHLPGRIAHHARERPEDPAFTLLSYRGTERVARTLTYRRVHGAATALARRLRAHSEPGDRVAILCDHGLDYVIGFLGCLYGGRIAVPLLPISGARNTERFDGVLADARPALCLISDGDTVTGAAVGFPEDRLLTPDVDADADDPVPEFAAHDLAYLQYTSGSTRSPAGVRITHANLAAALTQLRDAVPPAAERPVVTWLPFFHDMGLVLGLALPLYCGVHGVTMAPRDFVKRPARWLRACSDYRAAVTGSPNFGLALAVSDSSPREREGLDLSGLDAVLNGAEPVRPEALDEFTGAFAGYGFRHRAHTPGFGLAEATLAVTITRPEDEPVTHRFDRTALAAGMIVPLADDAAAGVALVGCGAPAGQEVVVVEAALGVEAGPGEIGEIWVSGPNVGAGYHDNPAATARTFGAALPGRAGMWLRTGDLGFVYGGQLYIAGRSKDLIVVDGRNHYPADIENTAAAATPHVRPGYLTAFGHDDGQREDVVIVAELYADLAATDDPADIARRIRSAVAVSHEVMPGSVVLVEPGRIPKTSSGKVRRADCRALYGAGRLPVLAAVGRQPPPPD